MRRATPAIVQERKQAFNALLAQGLTVGSTCIFWSETMEAMTVVCVDVDSDEDSLLRVQHIGPEARFGEFNADPRVLTLIAVWGVEALRLLLSFTVTSEELQAFLQRPAPTNRVAEELILELQKKLDERVAQEQSLVAE